MTITTNDLINAEARAHADLVRLVNEYPSSCTTFAQVLNKLIEVGELNERLSKDEQFDSFPFKVKVDPSIPSGELHLRNELGRTVGKIINIGVEDDNINNNDVVVRNTTEA